MPRPTFLLAWVEVRKIMLDVALGLLKKRAESEPISSSLVCLKEVLKITI